LSLLSVTAVSDLLASNASAQAHSQPGPGKTLKPQDLVPVKVPPMHHPTEKNDGPPPTPIAPVKRIGYALVGLGKLTIAEILPAFGSCKFSKVVALVSGDADKAGNLARQYGVDPASIYNYENFDNIKNNPEVDVVYIVLPNSMHKEFVLRSARAGKEVLCEKPMTTNSKDAQQMIDACKTAGKKLMIAYRIQYEPNNRMVRSWVRDNKYGKVRLIESTNVQNAGDARQWRLNKALAGGGSLPDIGLYSINTARFLLGEEPEWVSATTYSTPGDDRFKEVEETVLFQMRFPSGVLLNSSCSYGVHDSKRYRVFADKGGWYGMDPAYTYNGLKMEVSHAEGKIEWKENPSLTEKDQFALEMDHMSLCVLENKPVHTPGEEGLQDQVIMEALYESARIGKPVTLRKISGIDVFRGPEPAELNG
jgi:predicted dehydrogenase